MPEVNGVAGNTYQTQWQKSKAGFEPSPGMKRAENQQSGGKGSDQIHQIPVGNDVVADGIAIEGDCQQFYSHCGIPNSHCRGSERCQSPTERFLLLIYPPVAQRHPQPELRQERPELPGEKLARQGITPSILRHTPSQIRYDRPKGVADQI